MSIRSLFFVAHREATLELIICESLDTWRTYMAVNNDNEIMTTTATMSLL